VKIGAAAEADEHRLHGRELHGGRHPQRAGAHQRLLKSASAIIGDGDTMVLPDVPATIFRASRDGVIIGKRLARERSQRDELRVRLHHFIDGSARGLLPPATLLPDEVRDTLAPLGPWLVTAERSRTRISGRSGFGDGTVKQSFNTNDMAHKIPRCIEVGHSIHTLEPGDVLAPHQPSRAERLPGRRPMRWRRKGSVGCTSTFAMR